MLGNSITIPVLIVIGAVIVITLTLHGKGQNMQTQLVNQPKIGGTEVAMKREGPWPECLGLGGTDCQRLIETYAEDVRGNVFIVPMDNFVTADFRTDRVRIFVDESAIVTKIPKRG